MTAGPTTALARFIVATPLDAIPPEVLHEAKRTLINLLAISLSASSTSGGARCS